MKAAFSLAFLLLLSMRLAFTAPAPTDETAEQAISRLREGMVESFNRGDIDRLLTFLDTNAVVTWQNGEVCEGQSAVKAFHLRMMSGTNPVVSKVTADPKVLGRHIQGDWAVSWGNLNDHFLLTDGSDLPLKSHFTATIARRGDEWRITAIHLSVNAFDNPVTSLAIKKVTWLVAGIALPAGLIAGGLIMHFRAYRSKSNPA